MIGPGGNLNSGGAETVMANIRLAPEVEGYFPVSRGPENLSTGWHATVIEFAERNAHRVFAGSLSEPFRVESRLTLAARAAAERRCWTPLVFRAANT